MMQKTRYVEDLADGEQVYEFFLVKSARLAETRAGKPYLLLTFSDRSGEISGPAWDNAESLEPICAVGAIVKVRGQVQTYNNRLQLQVKEVEPVDESECDSELFVAASLRGQENMWDELDRLIGSVRTPYLKKLLKRIFDNDVFGGSFRTAPAAKGIHHAYLGGLLEHSLSMAQVASLLAGHYPGVDRDLLVAGALLHDIGKTEELLNATGVIEYTDIGRLKGHLVIGCEMIGRIARTINDFPDALLIHLQHLVLSHHGRLEFGSPVVPMTAEALLLSFIDDMDAKMNLLEQLSRKVKNDEPQWSEYQRSLERYLLLRPMPGIDEVQSEGQQQESPVRQQSLF